RNTSVTGNAATFTVASEGLPWSVLPIRSLPFEVAVRKDDLAEPLEGMEFTIQTVGEVNEKRFKIARSNAFVTVQDPAWTAAAARPGAASPAHHAQNLTAAMAGFGAEVSSAPALTASAMDQQLDVLAATDTGAHGHA